MLDILPRKCRWSEGAKGPTGQALIRHAVWRSVRTTLARQGWFQSSCSAETTRPVVSHVNCFKFLLGGSPFTIDQPTKQVFCLSLATVWNTESIIPFGVAGLSMESTRRKDTVCNWDHTIDPSHLVVSIRNSRMLKMNLGFP